MAKAVLCDPDKLGEVQRWFSALPNNVSVEDFPVTHGIRMAVIDHATKDNKKTLLEGIRRQQAHGSLLTFARHR